VQCSLADNRVADGNCSEQTFVGLADDHLMLLVCFNIHQRAKSKYEILKLVLDYLSKILLIHIRPDQKTSFLFPLLSISELALGKGSVGRRIPVLNHYPRDK
jgi:hypothetical protein